jgi:hypothetical protein
MDRTACTELQCLYKGALYFYLTFCKIRNILFLLNIFLTAHGVNNIRIGIFVTLIFLAESGEENCILK